MRHACVFVPQVSDKFAFSLFDLDWDVFMQHIEGAINRVPALEQTGIKSTVCGPGTRNQTICVVKQVNGSNTNTQSINFGQIL